jgi:hypothetical protein
MEPVQHHDGSPAVASTHVCPKCGQVGRVFRSWPRSVVESIALKFLPLHGLYRCHDCNWRGWKVRSSASPVLARIMLIVYSILLAAALFALIIFLRRIFPTPQRMP